MKTEIKRYKAEKIPSDALILLLREKYGQNTNFDYFLNDFKLAFDFCVDNENIHFEPIAVFFEGKMIAHIALIKDFRTDAQEAFFGFFESPNDQEVFDLLWNELILLAKNRDINLIKGPINGSIWHQYRVVKDSDGSDYFKSEMMCESYYYNLLGSKNPKEEIKYHSGYRERFDVILKAGEGSYEEFIKAGFSVQELKVVDSSKLKEIMLLSKKVFKTNWGFTNLTESEFLRLYSGEKIESLSRLYLLYKGEEVIGFSSILKENDDVFIFKTICVASEYLGLGFGNALAFKVHYDAKKEGIKKIIYALVRESNSIKNFPKDDAVIFRKYVVFEFVI